MTAISAEQQKIIDGLITTGKLNLSQVASIEAAANKALGRPVIQAAEGVLSTPAKVTIYRGTQSFEVDAKNVDAYVNFQGFSLTPEDATAKEAENVAIDAAATTTPAATNPSTNSALNLANLQSMLAGDKEPNLAFDANGDGKLSIQDTISFLRNTKGLGTPGQEDFFDNIYNPPVDPATTPPATTTVPTAPTYNSVENAFNAISLGKIDESAIPVGTPIGGQNVTRNTNRLLGLGYTITDGVITAGPSATTPPATTTTPPATTILPPATTTVPPATTGTDQPGNPLTGEPYGGKGTDPVTGLPINAAELLPNTGAATVNPALNVNPNDPQGLATTVVKLPEGATTGTGQYPLLGGGSTDDAELAKRAFGAGTTGAATVDPNDAQAVAGGTTPSTLDEQTNAVFNPASGTFTTPSTLVAPTVTTGEAATGVGTGTTTIDPGFSYAADDTTTTTGTTQQTDQERLGENMFKDETNKFFSNVTDIFNPRDAEGNTFDWKTADEIDEDVLKAASPEQIAMYDFNGNGEIDKSDMIDLRVLQEYNTYQNMPDTDKPEYFVPLSNTGIENPYGVFAKAQERLAAKDGIPDIFSSVLDTAEVDRAIGRRSAANILDPTGAVIKQDVSKVDSTDPGQYVDKDTGQISPTGTNLAAVQGSATTSQLPPDITAAKIAAAKSAADVAASTADVTAVKGEVSEGAKVTGVQGELSEGAIADAATMDPKFVDEVTSGTRSVSSEELAKAQGLDEEAIKANIAKANVPDNIKSAQGTVDPNEIPNAAKIAESDMAQAESITADGLSDDAIAVAAKLKRFSVDDKTLAEFKEGKIEAQDTVQGQLASLMADFDDGTPAWAAGAIRAANAAMASRGMGGSSMAGAAILQAAMESALPIASADANAFREMKIDNLNRQQKVSLANAAAQQGVKIANFNAEQQATLQNSQNAFSLQTQNLSNMQQTVIANAQIRATLQGQNLSNQQQVNIAEAARYAEMNNINLNNRQQGILQDNANELQVNLTNASAKQQAYIANAQIAAALQGQKIDNQQQVAISNAARFAEANNLTFTASESAKLHNSNLLKTIGIAELNAKQSAVLQNAASIASMDMANLDNRQQAAVQNAKAFLEMDLTNLSNENKLSLFKAEMNVQAILADTLAENFARQTNAASENSTNQFITELASNVAEANANQINAMERSNVSEINAMTRHMEDTKTTREVSNANNAIVIAKANAIWRQNIATTDTLAQNMANANDAMALNNATQASVDAIWRRESDVMDYLFKSYEGEQLRDLELLLQSNNIDAQALTDYNTNKSSRNQLIAYLYMKD